MKRIVYAFTGGRRSRLQAVCDGKEAPMEFLFGLPYLRSRGYDVDLLELPDLAGDQQSSAVTELECEDALLQRATGFTSSSHYFVNAIDTLNSYDAIIAGGDSIALGISHFVRQGVIQPPLFMMGMGMLLKSQLGRRSESALGQFRRRSRDLYHRLHGRDRRIRRTYRSLLASCRAIVYFERSEYDLARRMFPETTPRLHLLTQCVDTEFWRPHAAPHERFQEVLFLGNDRVRDYDVLREIAEGLPHVRFHFITSRFQSQQLPANVTLTLGDWKTERLSDTAVRDCIWRSALVILPLRRESTYTLTSTALQAMACARAVIVTKTRGSWEPEFGDREHVWLVRSRRVDEWRESINALLCDSRERTRVGDNARRLVEHHHNLTVLGTSVEALLTKASHAGHGSRRPGSID